MRRKCLYHCKTKAGVFWIAPQPGSPGRFWLGIGDVPLGSYHTPEAAADDVHCQSTGWNEWDMLGLVSFPTELADWTKGSVE